jgi:hypothetical protein
VLAHDPVAIIAVARSDAVADSISQFKIAD